MKNFGGSEPQFRTLLAFWWLTFVGGYLVFRCRLKGVTMLLNLASNPLQVSHLLRSGLCVLQGVSDVLGFVVRSFFLSPSFPFGYFMF